MADVAVHVTGLDELRRALRVAGDIGLKKALLAANKDAAQVVVTAALPKVPVRSGKLKGSVRALASQQSGRAVAGKASVPYAGAIHWGRKVGNVGRPPGNRKGRNPIRGRPFLWDTAEAMQRQVAREYETAIDRLVDSVERAASG